MKIMELSLVNKLKQLPIEPTYVVTEKNADIVNSLHLLETNREIKPNKVDDIVKAIQEGLLIHLLLYRLEHSLSSKVLTEHLHIENVCAEVFPLL